MELGESIVASYLRHVEGCDLVLHNTYAGEQAEIDVIGINLAQKLTILSEVATHILGLNYGKGNADTLKRIETKISHARKFAERTFPRDRHRYEFWSPVVNKGILTQGLSELSRKYQDTGLKVVFVTNETYAERVQELIEAARKDAGATAESAYRLLQILTRVRGVLRV